MLLVAAHASQAAATGLIGTMPELPEGGAEDGTHHTIRRRPAQRAVPPGPSRSGAPGGDGLTFPDGSPRACTDVPGPRRRSLAQS